MTYGDISTRLREVMIWLLERRRITQQLGGPGSHFVPVTTTEAEQAVFGHEIQQYRDAVLTYCVEAMRAMAPTARLKSADRLDDPVDELRRRLEITYGSGSRVSPIGSSLERSTGPELLAQWQEAARLAVQGEREIASLRQAALPRSEQLMAVKDTTDLIRGLLVLDARYGNVPQWTHLHEPGRLMTAATAASEHLDEMPLDRSIDSRGWRPTPGLITGAPLPGLGGVLQAQHSVTVTLMHFPSAGNLRHVLVEQAGLSQRAARLAQPLNSQIEATFLGRAALYRELVAASRVLGGQIGDGRLAAQESAHAASRVPHAPTSGPETEHSLGQLAHLCDRVDARVAAAVEHGFGEKLYFVAIKLPTMGRPGPDGVTRAAEKYIPVDLPVQSDLLRIVRERLRPPQRARHSRPAPSRESSDSLHSAIARERWTIRRDRPPGISH